MPTPTPGQLATTIAIARSGPVSLASLTNLYLEANPEGSKSAFTLYGTPGLKPWLTVGSGPIRGIERMGSVLYVVSGQELYHVTDSGVATLVGSIEGVGNVHTSNNGTHVAIAVTGGKLYAASLAAGVLELPQSNMNGATYQDGYCIFSQAGTQNFWLSGLDDLTTIDPLDFSTADAFPDDVMGLISDHRELWIFGKESAEVWYNSGAASFPFARAGAGYIEHGCRAPGSIAKAENSVFWLGDDLAVYAAQGYQAQPISDVAIETLIAGTVDPGSAWAFSYRQLGHLFYVLNFSDLTLVYDITSGSWHKRESEGLDRWRVSAHSAFGDTHIAGDCINGQLYELDLDTYDDDGDTIRREMVSHPMQSQGNRAQISELFVDLEAGVGLGSGQGEDPQIVLDWTDNGGASWSNELSRSMGKIGERNVRVTWARLGTFRQRTMRIAITDPVKVAIIGAYVRAQGLAT